MREEENHLKFDKEHIEDYGDEKRWYKGNRLHRIEGPAVERIDGSKSWYQDGERHRVGGPAIEWKDGTKEWFLNGDRHRLDGPAIQYFNGKKSWYIRGIFFKTKEAFFNHLTDEEKKIALFSEDFHNA